MSNNSEVIALPKYISEKINGVYEVYNTIDCVVEDVYPGTAEGKEAADTHVKKLLNPNNK